MFLQRPEVTQCTVVHLYIYLHLFTVLFSVNKKSLIALQQLLQYVVNLTPVR